jgi:hypothetical protein
MLIGGIGGSRVSDRSVVAAKDTEFQRQRAKPGCVLTPTPAAVKRCMNEVKAVAAASGCVETLFGHLIALPEIRGGSGPHRSGADRQAQRDHHAGARRTRVRGALRGAQVNPFRVRVADRQSSPIQA